MSQHTTLPGLGRSAERFRSIGIPPGSWFFCLSIVFVSVVCLWGCNRDPQTRKQKFYNRGLAYLQKGKPNEAALQFMNALQIDPKFAEAANILAEIEFRRRNYHRALSLLEQAIAVKPGYLPAHRGLGRIDRLRGKPEDAQKEFTFILERVPDDIDALLNLGLIQAQRKQFADAEGTFNRILELQPNHIGALISLASLKENTNDLPAAERYLKLATEKNPRSLQAQLQLIRFYIASRQTSAAEQAFPRALQMTGNNVQILQAQAGFYEGLNRFAEAEAVISRVQSAHPDDPKYWRTLADFYVRRNDWTRTEAELNRVLAAHKNDTDALHQLIEVHLTLNDRKNAESLNNALLKRNPKDAYAHLFKGRLYLLDGDVNNAMVEFVETAHYQPDSPGLHYWLAQAHIQQGEIQQAKQELETALRYDPLYDAARLSLTKLDNASAVFDRAMANATLLVKHRPEDIEAILAYSQALIGKRDYADARKIVEAALKRAPGNAEAHRLSGILFLSDRNLPAARAQFTEGWKLDPHSKPLLENVLLGYLAAKQPAEAVQFLETELNSHPADPLLYEELGQAHLWRHDLPAAAAALEKALNLAPESGGSAILLAETYAAQKRKDDAAKLLVMTVQKHSQDAALTLRAAMTFEKLERWDDARKAYSRILELDNDNVLAKNNLAWLLAEHGGNIDIALTLAQQAQERSANNPQIMDTIGWVYYKKGVYKTALDYLKQCVARDQNNATFQYQFGMVEWKLGNREEARRSLRTALALDPGFADAPSAKAALAQL